MSERPKRPVWSVALSVVMMLLGAALLLPGIGFGLCVVLIGKSGLTGNIVGMTLAAIAAGLVLGAGGLALILWVTRPKR